MMSIQTLQQTAAAILVPESTLSLGAAAAVSLAFDGGDGRNMQKTSNPTRQEGEGP